MPSIEEIRRVVKDEQRMLDMISRLSPEQFSQLMSAQAHYSKVLQAQHEAKKAEEEAKKAQVDKETRMKAEEEQTAREKLRIKERTERAERDRKHQMELVAKQTDEEKARVDYALQRETEVQKERTQIKLEAKKEFDKLDEERKRRETEALEAKARLRKMERDEEYARMAELEKIKIAAKAEADRKAEVELADHRLAQQVKMFEATKEEETRRRRELLQIEWEAQKEMGRQKWDAMLNFFTGDAGRERMRNIGALFVVGGTVVFAVRTGVPIATQYLRKYFFAPSLVSRQVTQSRWGRLFGRGGGGDKIEVVLRPSLEERMNRILKSTQLTSERRGYYGNMLLYGKPGTGKTLWAEKLAREANMDFAVMSGPSFDQFETGEAIREIKNLFSWVSTRNKGVLLFIDEADSFLEDRSTMHPHRVSVLNEWINQTGTESDKFMCVYETNRPEILDPAVQSRVSAAIEFETPEQQEILLMLKLYVKKYISSDRKIGTFRKVSGLHAPWLQEEENLNSLAGRLAHEGFVGRDVSNLAINLFKAGTGTGKGDELTEELIEQVVQEQIQKKRTEAEYSKIRAQRLKDNQIKLLSNFLK